MFLIPLSGNADFTITMNDIWLGTAAGLLMCLGRIFVTIGVAVGLAGPAEALMSTHALYQSLLSAIFADQSLTVLEILGVLLGLAGVFFMAFLDTCVDRIKAKNEIKRLKMQEANEAQAGADGAKKDADKEFFDAPGQSEPAQPANAIQ